MRSIGHGIKHLFLAVIWLVALVCISEVALRAHRWHAAAYRPSGDVAPDTAIVAPSAVTYQQLRPLLGQTRHGDGRDLRTNAFGLRGAEIALPKPAGVFRVICLGDDTTLARHLPEEETYCERLRVYLQERTQLRVEVINAGLPGGCPLTGLLLMRHHLLGLQPDLVVQHVDPTDVADDRIVRPFTFMDAQGTPLAAMHPSCRQTAAPTLLSLSQEFLLIDRVQELLVTQWGLSGGDGQEAWHDVEWEMAAEQALAPLAQLQSLVGGGYCEVIISAADDPLREPTDTVAHGFDGIRPAGGEGDPPAPVSLATYARAQRLLYLDASAELRARAPDEPPLIVETAEEHDLYAALLAEFVMANVPGVWSAPTSGAPGVLPSPGAPQPLTDAESRPRRP